MTENIENLDGQKVRKAVIPVAGLGTRFLPVTKATPKEMLPVVDKPAIQYVVEEAVAAGLIDVLMITGRSKRAVEDHFDRVDGLEAALAAKGDEKKLDLVKHTSELADIHFVRQGDPLGLGHAVLKSAGHVGREPFAVLLGDDLIDERDPLLTTMIDVQQRTGGSVIGLMEVDPAHIDLYGCAAVTDTDEKDVVRVNSLVEKPPVGSAPSNLAIIGRYVLAPEIFGVLRHTGFGRGNEIQLTDALQALAGDPESHGVYGVVFRGRRYDTGDKVDYLKAVVQLAAGREDLGPEFSAWLKEFSASLP